MKIAVYHNLPSGGAKRSLYEQVKRLSKRHSIDVFTLSTSDLDFGDLRPYSNQHFVYDFKSYPLFPSPFGRLNNFQRWRTLLKLDTLSQKIAKNIDENHYDLVYVQPCLFTQSPIVLKYLQTHSVYFAHEPLRSLYEPEIPRPYITRGWRDRVNAFDPFIQLFRSKVKTFDSESLHKATVLLVNSRFSAKNVAEYYSRQAQVSYLGIDETKFYPLPNVEKKKYVLSVGAIQPTKGFDFLITSLACIPLEARPALHIVGNAKNQAEYQYLQHLAQANQVNLVIETKVTDDVLVHKYNEASLFAYAPVREPLGLVPLEAMACGTPVVGVKEGGVVETILDGVTGRLIPRDPGLFAQAIQDLLHNPQKLAEMGQRGREWICSNWGWDKSIADLERVFQEVAAVD